MALPAQLKMFMPMMIMWGYNKFGLEWPVDILRIAYGTVQAIALVSYLFVYSRIEASASTTEKLTVKSKQATGPEKTEELTVKEYDHREAKGALGRLVMGAVVVVGLHSWKGFLQPLVIQAVMGLVLLLEDPLVRIYVLGQAAEGALARPFKKDVSPFAQLLGQNQEQDDAAAEGASEETEGSADGNGSGAGSKAAVTATAKKEAKKSK